jgi:hypothetical protein
LLARSAPSGLARSTARRRRLPQTAARCCPSLGQRSLSGKALVRITIASRSSSLAESPKGERLGPVGRALPLLGRELGGPSAVRATCIRLVAGLIDRLRRLTPASGLQNRQGGATPRLEGSIPSPRRGGEVAGLQRVLSCGQLDLDCWEPAALADHAVCGGKRQSRRLSRSSGRCRVRERGCGSALRWPVSLDCAQEGCSARVGLLIGVPADRLKRPAVTLASGR